MEFALKTLSLDAVPRALAKAERYRLLNEPGEAESICLDALAVDLLVDEYERAYYTGLVHERRAKAQLRHGAPGCGPLVYEWLRQAMVSYEQAEAIRPAGNDDAILRWNACARLIMSDSHLVPRVEQATEPLLLE